MSFTNSGDNFEGERETYGSSRIVGPPSLEKSDDFFEPIRFYDDDKKLIIDEEQLPRNQRINQIQRTAVIPLYVKETKKEEEEEDVVLSVDTRDNFGFQDIGASYHATYRQVNSDSKRLPSIHELGIDSGSPNIVDMEQRNDGLYVEPLLEKLSQCPPSDVSLCPPRADLPLPGSVKKKKKKKQKEMSMNPNYVPSPPPKRGGGMSEKERFQSAAPVLKTRSGRTVIKMKLSKEEKKLTGRKRKRRYAHSQVDYVSIFDGDDEHSTTGYSDEDFASNDRVTRRKTSTRRRKVRKRGKGKTSPVEQPPRKKRKLSRNKSAPSDTDYDASGETTGDSDLYQPTETELSKMYEQEYDEDEDDDERQEQIDEKERRRKKRKRKIGHKKRRKPGRRKKKPSGDNLDFIPSPYGGNAMNYYDDGENPKVLENWFLKNLVKPYPSKAKKLKLEEKSGMSTTQVSDWFSNRRKRVWLPAKRVIKGEFSKKKEAKEKARLVKQDFGKTVYDKLCEMEKKGIEI